MNRFNGDQSLLESYKQSFKHPSGFVEWITVAWCWDHYPLIDGTLNPTGRFRRPADVKGHLLIAPPEDDINNAFNQVIGSVLPENDTWVLTIPRAIGYTRTVDAKALFSDSGGCAMVLPMAMLGAFYVMNEIVFELRAAAHSRLPEEKLSFIRANYPDILAYLLIQKQPTDNSIRLSVLELDPIRYERSTNEGEIIWSIGTAQQLYVILHEFGHLIHSKRTDRAIIADGIYHHPFWGKDQETQVDIWAARILKQGRDRSEKWPHWETIRIAILILFGAMELLRSTGFLEDVDRDTLATRLATVLFSPTTPGWSPLHTVGMGDELLSMADDILWGRA